jgi:hypothetical protein
MACFGQENTHDVQTALIHSKKMDNQSSVVDVSYRGLHMTD